LFDAYEMIGKAKLKMLRVYLKEKSFYEEARELLEGYNLNIRSRFRTVRCIVLRLPLRNR